MAASTPWSGLSLTPRASQVLGAAVGGWAGPSDILPWIHIHSRLLTQSSTLKGRGPTGAIVSQSQRQMGTSAPPPAPAETRRPSGSEQGPGDKCGQQMRAVVSLPVPGEARGVVGASAVILIGCMPLPPKAPHPISVTKLTLGPTAHPVHSEKTNILLVAMLVHRRLGAGVSLTALFSPRLLI